MVGQKAISKWGRFDNFLLQIFYFKVGQRERESYFKVGHCLCQSEAKFISKWKNYFKEHSTAIL